MEDEPKQTKQEKREAARQARIEEQRRKAKAKRRRKILFGGTAAVLAIVLIVIAVMKISENRGRSGTALAAARKAAGCDEIKEYPDAGHQHIDGLTADKRVPYTTEPPTSGDHYGVPPPAPDFYTEPAITPERYVHGLEHGQIYIHDNGIPQDQIDKLEKIQKEHPDSTSVMKNPAIKKPVVITAWRYMQQCDKVSEPVIENFIRERCNKGIEKLTPSC